MSPVIHRWLNVLALVLCLSAIAPLHLAARSRLPTTPSDEPTPLPTPMAALQALDIDFDSVAKPPEALREPIRTALSAMASRLPSSDLTLTAFRVREPQGDWAYAVVLPSELLGERVEETSAASYLALLGQRDASGEWRFAAEGTADFAKLARSTPTDFIEFSLEVLNASTASVAQTVTMSFLFPWTANQRWYKTQGWHGGSWPNALDLQPSARGYNLDISREFAVLAAERGRLEVNCNDGTTISLVVFHPNGQGTLYVHMDARTFRRDLVGKQIDKGQYLGHLYRTGNTNNGVGGSYRTGCGYGEAAHLHFALPTRSMTINGFSAESVSSALFATLYTSANQRVENPTTQPGVSLCGSPELLYCAEYYNNRSLSGSPVFTQNESRLNRPWGLGGPGNGVGVDNFSARWKGRRYFPTSGWWNFWLGADDGVRLWVDGQLVIDNWVDTPYSMRYARRQMTAGYHEVKVEYYEAGGAAAANLCIAPHGQFCAEYYSNTTLANWPITTIWESAVNKNWGSGSPGGGISVDTFSVRWRGRHYFNGATQVFRACADDGIRVFIDGVPIINRWQLQPYTCVSQSYAPAAGWHNVRVEYFEQSGGAAAKVIWSQATAAAARMSTDDVPPSATVVPPPAADHQVFLPQLSSGSGVATATPEDEDATSTEIPEVSPTSVTVPANVAEVVPTPNATPVWEP